MASELIACISAPVRADGHVCQVGASIGIARFRPGGGLNAGRLLSHSDIALYNAKECGNSTTLLEPEMIREQERTKSLIAEVEAGIRNNEFVPYFQPQVDLSSGQIHGLEVLARWNHPRHGTLPPSTFLEAAIRSNLMGEIDRQVRQNAMRVFSGWLSSGKDLGRLSLNLTASNLRSSGFVEDLLDEMLTAGLGPGTIQLELLESILFDQSDAFLVRQCQALRSAGFLLALDDFGTGHSSIATLIEAPVSMLKIDRSFVSGLGQNPKLLRVTGSMLAMAGQMGLEVLAEGVERREELEFLVNNGCRLFQGYFFAAPMEEEEALLWIENWQKEPVQLAS